MDDGGLLEAYDRDGVAIANAAVGHLPDPIPAVEGWTVADVVEHVGSGDRWIINILSGMSGHDALAAVPEPPPVDERLDWYLATHTELRAALDAVGDDDRGWTLDGHDQPLRFWRRRRAQENAVHRWDVEGAATTPAPIPADVAVDGVDEMFEVFIPRIQRRNPVIGTGETMHLHATDADGEWMVTFGPDGVTWERGHAKGDVAARAPASDLLLFLWGRVPPGRLEVFGDAALLDRWQAEVQI